MNKFLEHSSFFLFVGIALVICKFSNGYDNNTWIVSILSSVIGGIIVDFITPSIATTIKKICLKNDEKLKVRLAVKQSMRKNINRIHDNTSKAEGIILNLRTNNPSDKAYKNIQSFLKNANENLCNLEKYFN
jgi:hypothetical protein